jgi:hypothetical protein
MPPPMQPPPPPSPPTWFKRGVQNTFGTHSWNSWMR